MKDLDLALAVSPQLELDRLFPQILNQLSVMCKFSNEAGKTSTSTINLVHSKRKGIFIHIKEMLNDPISPRSQRSYLTFRLH